MDVEAGSQVASVIIAITGRKNGRSSYIEVLLSERKAKTTALTCMHDGQGVGSKKAHRAIKELCRIHRPCCLVLIETWINGEKATAVIDKLGFSCSFRVECEGFSGGIWILWQSEILDVEILQSHKQFIHTRINFEDGSSSLFTAIYGSPRESERHALWQETRQIASSANEAWCLAGDWNTLLCPADKKGGTKISMAKCNVFRNWLDECGLLDIKFVGPRFTWARNNVMERLDRAVGNTFWHDSFRQAFVQNLPRIKSDHNPMLLRWEGHATVTFVPRPFRFQAAWLSHPSFKSWFANIWDKNQSLTQSLMSFVDKVQVWNKEVFGHIMQRKKKLMDRIAGIQRTLCRYSSDSLINLEKELREELTLVLEQEEMLWFQKSRSKWLVHGDRNTKYFHALTMVKRKRQKIDCLEDNNGSLITDQGILAQMASEFYAKLFTAEPTRAASGYISGIFPSLSEAECDSLQGIPGMDEIRVALFNIGALKAPGPDGLHALFFQSQWQVVHKELVEWVQKVFRGEESLVTVNETHLCLIPKVPNPTRMVQFRPIGLCNVTYKIISKILVQRLKGLMPKLVSKEQTSFVPGRHMIENILIAQETLHSFHTRKGKSGFMAIKVDLEKAYDRVNWDFLHHTLQDIGIPDLTLKLIMHCVRSPSMKVLWNGAATNSFYPQRGVRQGDPLSPYLFVLCLERLSQKISQLVNDGIWKPMRFGRTGPRVSHLFFADDLLLFAEASPVQAELIKATLQEFCDFSGQKVSDSKTRVLFSHNIPAICQHSLSQHMGFTKTNDLGKYLGMPLVQGRVTKRTYEDLCKKVEQRISGWKAETLSLAGRITLAKSVLTAIPSFAMQTTKIPAGLCEAMDRKIRKFIWGTSAVSNKVHLVAWHKICLPKEYGGLGFRSLRQQNEAFLMKVAWGIITRPDDLWVRIFRHKYGQSSWSRSDVKRKGCVSYQWRSILSIWDRVQRGIRWRLGNGKSVSFWHDIWLDVGRPLSQFVSTSVLGENAEMTVSQFISESGTWRWDLLPRLPSEVYMLIAAMKAPSPSGPPDQIAWGPTTSGTFTIASAFELIYPAIGDSQKLWKLIWRWNGPQRIRSFLWLCGHNALMTNERRCHMGISDDARCPRCSAGCETSLHVIRDCFYIQHIWKQIIHPSCWVMFFGCDLADWLTLGLSSNLGNGDREEWNILFGVTMWLAWKWRNDLVFNLQEVSADAPLSIITNFQRDIVRANQARLEVTNMGCKHGEMIGWRLPDYGWIKINSDGACHRASNNATAGGLLRDHLGNWIRGYTHRIGYCSSNLAELWGALDGLELAWNLGYRKVVVEMDSITLVTLLQSHSDHETMAGSEVLLKAIHSLCQRDWEVRFTHTLREGNRCADWLANYAFEFQLGLHHLEEPPQLLKSFLFSDVIGLQWLRGV